MLCSLKTTLTPSPLISIISEALGVSMIHEKYKRTRDISRFVNKMSNIVREYKPHSETKRKPEVEQEK